MRISDWSSDVCSSDLPRRGPRQRMTMEPTMELDELKHAWQSLDRQLQQQKRINLKLLADNRIAGAKRGLRWLQARSVMQVAIGVVLRSEEHTSELQSLMRNSYDVFCLKKNTYIYNLTI